MTESERAQRVALITLGVVLVYIFAGDVAGVRAVVPDWRVLATRYGLAAPLFTAGLVPPAIALCIWRLRVRDGGHRVNGLRGWRLGFVAAYEDGWFTSRPLGYYGIVLLLPVFFWAFGSWKASIPPFTAERTLAHISIALHGGPAYTLLGRLMTPRAVALFEQCYQLWWYALAGVIVWRGWCGSPLDRARFWLAFVLTWIALGTVLASMVPSAGPWYYARVTGKPSPFQPLIDYLVSVDRMTSPGVVSGIEGLWRAQASGAVGLGAGISAFPSLHVAFPVLGACATWRRSRVAAVGFAAFAVAVLVASVCLGWHYAVDGYASIALVPLVWLASDKFVERVC